MRPLAAAVLVTLAISPSALGATADSTFLIDRPLGGLPGDSIGDSFNASPGSVSGDGNLVVFESGSDALLPASADRTIDHVFLRDRGAQTTTMMDATLAGVPGDQEAFSPVISADGTRVAFVSAATNLASETIQNRNLYVRTVATGDLEIASRATGAAGALDNGSPGDPVLDADGSVVAFSSANKLDPVADTNTTADIYTRDLVADTTTLMSREDGAAGAASTATCEDPAISADGTRVAFTARGTLDPGLDTNGRSDIYLRTGNTTTLVSRQDGAGTGPGNESAQRASMNGAGTAIAFHSSASDLVAGDTNGVSDVFVRTTGQTELISRPDGSTATLGDEQSTSAAFSANGAQVGFISGAGNLVAGVGPAGDRGGRAFVRVLATDATRLVSRVTGGAAAAPVEGDIGSVALDTDGNTAIFGARAANLPLPGPDAEALFARSAGVTSHVTGPTGSTSPPAATSDLFVDSARAMSADGRLFAFASGSDGLSDADVDRYRNVFVKNTETGALTLLTPGADGDSLTPVISADGTKVAFTTAATTLGPAKGVYVHDIASGARTLASRADGSAGTPADADLLGDTLSLDADGSRLAFESSQDIETAVDANGEADIYVRDLTASTTVLASRATGAGTAAGAGESSNGRLDGTGTRVVFESQAANLGDGDTTPAADIHVRDLSAQTTVLVSSRDGIAMPPGNLPSSGPTISDDGTRVVFLSEADDLEGTVDDNSSPDVYLRDLAAGTTRLVSRAGLNGAIGENGSLSAVISGDGLRVAFLTESRNLHPETTTFQPHLLVRTLATGATYLASRADGATGAIVPGIARPALELASISADGTCVGFTTPHTGLEPDGYPSPDFSHLHVRAVSGVCPRPTPTPTPTATPTPTPTPAASASVAPAATSTPAPTVTPAPDAVAPKVTKIEVTRKRIRFTLSEPGKVAVTVDRRKDKRYRRITKLTKPAETGRNAFKFPKRLRRGPKHRIRITATDAAGNASARKTRSARFAKRG